MEMTLLLTSKRIDKKLHLESQIVKLSKGSTPLGAVQIFKWSESARYHCF